MPMSNAALAGYRKARATEMALAGCDYDTIAKELGYANRSGAWKASNAQNLWTGPSAW